VVRTTGVLKEMNAPESPYPVWRPAMRINRTGLVNMPNPSLMLLLIHDKDSVDGLVLSDSTEFSPIDSRPPKVAMDTSLVSSGKLQVDVRLLFINQ
jgi:hypothetical protein